MVVGDVRVRTQRIVVSVIVGMMSTTSTVVWVGMVSVVVEAVVTVVAIRVVMVMVVACGK